MTTLKNSPLVTVVCPAFNAAETLRASVQSVIEQTYKNLQIVIVDDGSSDETISIAEALAREDQRIEVHSQTNSGSCIARNKGFSLANGFYVSVIDADDLWPPWKIQEQVELLKSNPDSIVIGGVRRFGVENGRWVWYHETLPFPYEGKINYLRRLLRLNDNEMVLLNTFCAKTEFIVNEGGWDPLIHTGHDWDVWIRLAKKHPFLPVPKVYQYYRKSKASATRRNSVIKVLDSHMIILERHGLDILKDREENRRLISERLIKLANVAFNIGNTSEARFCLRKACMYRPALLNQDFYRLLLKTVLRTVYEGRGAGGHP